MKKVIKGVVLVVISVIVVVASGYTDVNSIFQKNNAFTEYNIKQNQTVNLFVTHGHCSTPFGGIVNDLK